MKTLLSVVLLSALFFSCKQNNTGVSPTSSLGDTIQTESGLKYYFYKKGNGRKIEPSSKVAVYTDLYVNNADTIFWSTATSEDSLLNFYHRKTPLISGFTEVHDYLSEGDEIIVIIPNSLAYGKAGRGAMPPSATLIYNPLVIKSVSEPKPLISDSLFTTLKTKGVADAIAQYETLINSKAKENYHSDFELLTSNLMRSLTKDSLFAEQEAIANFLVTKTEDQNYHRNLAVQAANAAEAQGKYAEAIVYLQPWANKEPNEPWWQNRIKALRKKHLN